jgi:RNA polymerase sigma-70 factor (ECF subfamily)
MAPSSVRAAFEHSLLLWPGLSLRLDELAEHAHALKVSDADVRRHGHELGLALACAQQDQYAIARLEPFLSQAKRVVHGLRVASDFADDVAQALRVRLLVGPTPKIRGYAARGPLGGWLRRAALHVGINLMTHHKNVPDAADNCPAVELEPYAQGVSVLAQQALDSALERLSYDNRQLLGSCALGSSIDRMSVTFGNHRATQARRLATLRTRLRREVTEGLRHGMGMSKIEAELELQRVSLDLHLGALRGEHSHAGCVTLGL